MITNSHNLNVNLLIQIFAGIVIPNHWREKLCLIIQLQ